MNSQPRPHAPRLAAWLIRRAADPAEARFVLGDMNDEFDEQARAVGASAARRWYWAETIRSIGPLVLRRVQVARRARPHTDLQRSDSMWQSTYADIRYAFRLSLRNRLASVAIITTMALGVGSTTAIFSAINAVLMRPLPFHESSRVVQLNCVMRDGHVIEQLAYPDVMDFRYAVPDFADVSVYQQNDRTLQHGPDPRLLHTLEVDDAYPRVFAVRAELGRLFTAGDMAFRAPKVVVLTHGFWMREYGGDRGIVGTSITLDGELVEVVGVLAADAYTFPRTDADALAPLVVLPNTYMEKRGQFWADASARLKPGATLGQTAKDLTAAAAAIAKEFPGANVGVSAQLAPLHDVVVGSVGSMLELLAAAVAAVLLIACLNIANLILGRVQARTREFALRTALGGSAARVRRQVLTESLLLAAVGGAIGMFVSTALTRALIAVYPDALPRAEEIGVDARVMAVAALVTIAAGVIAAIPTARRASRLDLNSDLRDGGRGGGSRRERRTGHVLIVAQVAASLTLLFSAGLLLQTFRKLTQVDAGFDPRGTTTVHVFAAEARYRTPADLDRYFADATAALQAIPGVKAVSTTSLLPFASGRRYDVFIQEERGDRAPNNPAAAIATVAAGYERALGLRLIRGRGFSSEDDSASVPVVLINEAIARRNYADADPIGRLITWNGKPHWRIIGVVGSTHLDHLWDEPMPMLFTVDKQAPRRSRYFVIRSDRPYGQILADARAALRKVDPALAVTDPATMDDRIRASLGPQRFRAALMAAFGVLALVLAIIGIYGVVAYTVSRRTREIGIRLALGEGAQEVFVHVVGDAMRVAGIGIAIGVVLSLAAGRSLMAFLIGVSPHDWALLAGAASVLAGVVVVAAAGPARRASRVDPMVALRGE